MSVLNDDSICAPGTPVASILGRLARSRDFKYLLQYLESNTCLITEGGAP